VGVLLLTGQRKTETAVMRWEDIDLSRGVWTIPGGVAKNGREHSVPLPQQVVSIISHQNKFATTEYVFSGRGGVPLSGWSKRQDALVEASGVDFNLHDLRKTFRSGLSRLGVDQVLAEMMLNHKRDDLVEIYDREPRLAERREAAQRWAEHVTTIIAPEPKSSTVVELPTA
jgi:integrase